MIKLTRIDFNESQTETWINPILLSCEFTATKGIVEKVKEARTFIKTAFDEFYVCETLDEIENLKKEGVE